MPRFSLIQRLRSIGHALRGIAVMLQTQQNAWVHLFATATVLIAGFSVGLTAMEWCWIIAAIVAVWSAEAFNTAMESVVDLASPQIHPLARNAKDVAAAAVLIAAMGAAAIGALVFWPYLTGR